MAIIYVRSTDGSNSDNGSTWALAKATIVGADAIDAANDTIYVSQVHAESTAAAASVTLVASRLVCANDGAEPPTVAATSAVVETTGSSANFITINGGSLYVYGITFKSAGSFVVTTTTSGRSLIENCTFEMGPGVATTITMGSSGGSVIEWKNVNVKFGAGASQSINMSGGKFTWTGGSIIAGGSPTSNLFSPAGSRPCSMIISGVDLSALSSTVVIFSSNQAPGDVAIIRNCKLPASWSGSLGFGALTPGWRGSMYNCDDGATNYRLRIEDYVGTIVSETTIVRTGGATDGTTPISWKMTSNANALYPHMPLDSDEIAVWNERTGTLVTATIEFIHDSVTALKDNEIYVDARYLSASNSPLGGLASDMVSTVLTTAANQDSSSATWTTTGLSNPNTQKLVVTFTPQMKGPIYFKVRLAKVSYTVYVDPKVTLQ